MSSTIYEPNSVDWEYQSERETETLILESSKMIAKEFIFQPNDQNTWDAVINAISEFLTTIWKEGALQGATEKEAFQVDCGLGATMTEEDILKGLMMVTIKVAPVMPAEFIVLMFQQQQATS